MTLQNYKIFTPYFRISPLFSKKNDFPYTNYHIFATHPISHIIFAIENLIF